MPLTRIVGLMELDGGQMGAAAWRGAGSKL